MQPQKNSSGCWYRLLAGGFLLWFFIVFRQELGQIARGLIDLIGFVFIRPASSILPIVDGIEAFLLVGGNCLVSVSVFFLVLILIIKFVLPVRNTRDLLKAGLRLSAYQLSLLGLFKARRRPTAFIREGKPEIRGQLRDWEETEDAEPGFAFVDLNSAVVVEREIRSHQLKPSDPVARVAGPGLTLLRWDERLRGVVSLRKQFRIQDVSAHTKDSIEVKTKAWVIFTLGQSARVVKVAYVGPERPENLCVLQIDENTQCITKLVDELDPDDKEEIHRRVADIRNTRGTEPLAPDDHFTDYPPYHLDTNRIKRAVYADTRGSSGGGGSDWSELPTYVAAQIFRDVLEQWSYDDLFISDDPFKHPLLDEVKPKFSLKMRNQGVLSYQFVQRRDGKDPSPGDLIDHKGYRIFPVKALGGNKILREAGIKVIFAGFIELVPDEIVKQQRLESWQARVQRDVDFAKAGFDREIILERNRAWVDAQREVILTLSQIFKAPHHSQEALVIHIFQTLESVAVDSEIRKYLPDSAINFMNSLGYMLLPDQYGGPSTWDPSLLRPRLGGNREGGGSRQES